MHIDSLRKDNYTKEIKDTPIEALFKSIILLEREGGMETVVKQLKKKLEKELEPFKVSRGKVFKKIDKLTYYPNGILEYSYRYDDQYSILLSGYDFELPEAKKLKKDRTPSIRPQYEQLKKISMLWYWQVKEYVGGKYTVSDYSQGRCTTDDIAFLEKYNELPDEAKQHVSEAVINDKINNCVHSWTDIMMTTTESAYIDGQSHWTYYYTLSYLNEEELEVVKAICTSGLDAQETRHMLKKFAVEKLSNEADEATRYTFMIKESSFSYSYNYVTRNKELFFKGFEALKRVSNEHARKALVNVNFIPEGMFIDEPLPESETTLNEKAIKSLTYRLEW